MTDQQSSASLETRAGLRRLRLIAWVLVFAALPFLIYFMSAKPREKPPPVGARDRFENLALEKPAKPLVAPDFTLENLSGRRVGLKDFRGKVVFLNFWATWCVPCRDEMPQMEALHREFKDRGLAVVAVNFREDKKAVGLFFKELGLSFESLLDPDGEIGERYGAFNLPLTYFVDRQGRFAGKAVGIRPWDRADAKDFIRELLDRKP
ncbi:MAG TPA: TlpA disulfide reductase family protein [Verrucomicrobiae bacterium]|jgi:thiol-disulfide isomerase/thioredoxin|nr:TlpA disulfide reductase family protein [Verrucomicrobiae bacterium]